MRTLPVLAAVACAALVQLGASAFQDAGPTYQERDFLTRVRRLTVEGRRSGEGYFSPDGKRMVFQSERDPSNPWYEIFTMDLTSGDVKRISPGLGKTTCSYFRPNSDEILFSSTHLDPKSKQYQDEELAFRASGKQRRYSWDYDPEMDIFVLNEKTGALKQLTTAKGYDAESAYSPDGQWIVFTSMRGAYNRTLNPTEKAALERDPSLFADIYIMKADGSGQKQLTTEFGYDGGPFFTSDGQRIVWRHFDDTGVLAELWTMKLDGSDQRQVTTFGGMNWSPFQHPSGQYFIFSSNKMGFENFELYIVDTDGKKEPVRVTYTDGFDSLPVFTPDGKQLSWTSTRSGGGEGQIFLAQWNHEKALEALRNAPPRKMNVK